MAQRVSVGDIQALIDFRAHLIEFNRELAEDFASMRGHWQSLGEVWSDDKYRELGQALAEVTPGIDRYLAATEEHEAHLLRLIQALEAVLDV